MPTFARGVSGSVARGQQALLAAAVVGLAVSLSPCRAGGKPAEADRRGDGALSTVALIDVEHVLEHYAAWRRRKEEIQAGIALAEATIKQRQKQVAELAQRLRTLEAGTSEHTELDLSIARQTAELREQIVRARGKYLAEQARAYAEAYDQIVREVEKLLDESGYDVVLRVNGTKGEESDDSAAALTRQLNRFVFSSAPQADISREILARLNDGQRKAANRMRRPASAHP